MTQRPRNAICIVCTDRFRSIDFYCKALGAKLLSGDYPVTCPWLRLGSLTLTLLENTDKVSPLEFSEHAMATLSLQVRDLGAAFARATKHGARVVEPPDEGGITFLIADPDGIFIEVMKFEPDDE